MLARIAITAIPTIAVAVTALVLLGPGSQRPAHGARVWGIPSTGSHVLALRIETATRHFGVDEDGPTSGLRVEASTGGRQLAPWTGATGADGFAEVRFESEKPLGGGLDIRITRAETENGALLAEGSIAAEPARPLLAQTASVPQTNHGTEPLTIQLETLRGMLAAPFADELRATVKCADHGARAELEITATGGEVSALPNAEGRTTLTLKTDDHGTAHFTAKPLAHQFDLTIHARAASSLGHCGLPSAAQATGHWEGTLPVLPGAVWLDPTRTDGPLVLVSPVPRDRAYLSAWSDEGRIFGAIVPLTRDPQGFYRGEVALPSTSTSMSAPNGLRAARIVTVSGDPVEQGAGTTAWPLQLPRVAAPPRIEMLFDGLPGAEARERSRSSAARRAGVFVVAAAALAEILLIMLRARLAQRVLDAHLVHASTEEDEGSPALSEEAQKRVLASARDYPVLRALVVVAVVGLAFAIVGALGTFR